MKSLKGIGLLLISNILIYLTLSITVRVLVNVVLPAFGIDVRGAFSQELLVWSLVIGFGGAFISLLFPNKWPAPCWIAFKLPSHAQPRNR